MNSVLQFPVNEEECFTAKYDPVSHRVSIPYIPGDEDAALDILAVFVALLTENGVLTEEQILQTVLQAVGDI